MRQENEQKIKKFASFPRTIEMKLLLGIGVHTMIKLNYYSAILAHMRNLLQVQIFNRTIKKLVMKINHGKLLEYHTRIHKCYGLPKPYKAVHSNAYHYIRH